VSAVGEPKLAVDDLVVYASHGVGRVASRRDETVKLEFEHGLSVTLPIARALECVRPVSTEGELAAISRTLGGSEVVSQENWQRRLKTMKSKVVGGDATSLAEVVRDGHRREERTAAKMEPGALSLAERQLYVTARKLLADEIAASRGIEPSAADVWIGDQLSRNQADKPSGAAAKATAPAEPTAVSSGSRARRRRR
jgi:RNA polymerase-interacting CarD/CdnL/TRCF family regulator